MMKEINQLALRIFGKFWGELSRDEKNELKRRPEWLVAAYGSPARSTIEPGDRDESASDLGPV